jgi:hypothetical protein
MDWQPSPNTCAIVRYGLHKGEQVTVISRLPCDREMWLCRLSSGEIHAYLPLELEAC